MTASFYQSGPCVKATLGAAFVSGVSARMSMASGSGRLYAPDRERQLVRREAPVLQLAPPGEAAVAHQLLDLERAVVRQAEFPQRRLELRFLDVMRVEADRNEDEV